MITDELARSMVPAFLDQTLTDIWVKGFCVGYGTADAVHGEEDEPQEKLWMEIGSAFALIENGSYESARKAWASVKAEYTITRK